MVQLLTAVDTSCSVSDQTLLGYEN